MPFPFVKRLLGSWFIWCALYKGFSVWFALPLWVVVLGTGATCVVAYAWQKQTALRTADDIFFCAGTTVFAVALTYCYGGNHLYAFVLVVLTALGIALYPVLRSGKELTPQISERAVRLYCILLSVIMFAVIVAISCIRYRIFATPNFDFGLFCNMFHYMRETGLPLVTSERNQLLSHFAVHISPIYYVLLPFYTIFPSPITLQISQAVIVASGILPLYALAKHFGLSGKSTVAVVFVYAAHPALSAGCFYDLHENCFLTPLLLWLFWCYETGKHRLLFLPLILVLLTKEDAAVYIAIFAVYLFFSRKDRRMGAILFGIAAAYFTVAILLLQTFGQGAMFGRYAGLFKEAKEAGGFLQLLLRDPGYFLEQIVTAADKTAKPLFALLLLLPFGSLLWKTKTHSRLLLLLPLLLNLLTEYTYQYNIGYQYSFGVTAFLFYLWIQNISETSVKRRRNPLLFSMAAVCLLYVAVVMPRLESYARNAIQNHETYARMEAVLDTIPSDASVTASTFLVAHLAERDIIYEELYHKTPDTEYVVLDNRKVYRERAEKYKEICLQNGYAVTHITEELLILQPTSKR
jgi:uncharacterized membrane protein